MIFVRLVRGRDRADANAETFANSDQRTFGDAPTGQAQRHRRGCDVLLQLNDVTGLQPLEIHDLEVKLAKVERDGYIQLPSLRVHRLCSC